MSSALCTRPVLLLAVSLHVSGCWGSTKIAGDAGTDPAVDPGVDPAFDTGADSTVDPGHDTTDAMVDPSLTCTSDSDCVVALHHDRCCSPDPVAVTRGELASDPCLHELGDPWSPSPDCEMAPCYACQPITKRFYAARCEAGECVGVEDFCAPMPVPEPVASVDTWSPPPGGWDQWRGQVIVARGNSMKGPDSCECCFSCYCDCFDNEVEWTLDCQLTVRGSACGVPWECSGTECDLECSPVTDTWGWLMIQGYLVDSEAEGFELWAMNGPNDCPPPGPNGEGEPCTPFDDDGGQCADGLICFYWGDILDRCIATCMPPGDECFADEDCPDGDVCHEGYCVWCCPG